jgi:hypothetical protein
VRVVNARIAAGGGNPYDSGTVAESTKRRLLRKAADLLGQDDLAVRLRVPTTLLDAWMRGLTAMPDRKLLLLADVLDKLAERKK